MPDCYTNVFLGIQALMRSGYTIASQPAFIAGANGADPFFMYQYYRKNASPNMRVLGARLQRESTGAFLLALLHNATTSVQQSYALGFVTNYTTSCTLNPYIAAMTATDMPYNEHLGAFRLATALDSEIYFRNYKTLSVPLHAGTPVLITEELAQVTSLLRNVLMLVYGQDISQVVLADMFHDNLNIRRMLSTSGMLNKFRTRFVFPKYSALYGGPLSCKSQPGERLKSLPKNWKNPHTGEEMNLTLNEVLALAEQTGGICVNAAEQYLLGELDEHQLLDIIGNNNYITGMPAKAKKRKLNIQISRED